MQEKATVSQDLTLDTLALLFVTQATLERSLPLVVLMVHGPLQALAQDDHVPSPLLFPPTPLLVLVLSPQPLEPPVYPLVVLATPEPFLLPVPLEVGLSKVLVPLLQGNVTVVLVPAAMIKTCVLTRTLANLVAFVEVLLFLLEAAMTDLLATTLIPVKMAFA